MNAVNDLSPSTPTCRGFTPLMYAAEHGHVAAAEALIRLGANADARDVRTWPAVYWAALNGHEAVVDALLRVTMNLDMDELLTLATTGGNGAIVKTVIGKGANVNLRTPLFCAAYHGHATVAEELCKAKAQLDVRDNDGNTALQIAAIWGRDAVVQMLLLAGADTEARNMYGHTALLISVSQGYTSVVEALLKGGAKAEAAALHQAVVSGNTAIVELLLLAGADKDALSSEGHTPLFISACYGYIGSVEALVKAGAQVDPKLLEIAVKNGNASVLEELFWTDADKQPKDERSQVILVESLRRAKAISTSEPRILRGHRADMPLEPTAELAAADARSQVTLQAARVLCEAAAKLEGDRVNLLLAAPGVSKTTDLGLFRATEQQGLAGVTLVRHYAVTADVALLYSTGNNMPPPPPPPPPRAKLDPLFSAAAWRGVPFAEQLVGKVRLQSNLSFFDTRLSRSDTLVAGTDKVSPDRGQSSGHGFYSQFRQGLRILPGSFKTALETQL